MVNKGKRERERDGKIETQPNTKGITFTAYGSSASGGGGMRAREQMDAASSFRCVIPTHVLWKSTCTGKTVLANNVISCVYFFLNFFFSTTNANNRFVPLARNP